MERIPVPEVKFHWGSKVPVRTGIALLFYGVVISGWYIGVIREKDYLK
jgi:hypothetical protein